MTLLKRSQLGALVIPKNSGSVHGGSGPPPVQAIGRRALKATPVAPEVAEQRIAAGLAAGGTVANDSNAPSLTVIADQDGNKGVLCVDVSAVMKD